MPSIRFTKMEGAGNDFVLLDGRNEPLADYSRFAAHYCRRRRGIGSDGLLVLLPPGEPGCDFQMRFFNPDGSEAAMCGNGARCIAIFANRLGAAGRRMRFGTIAGSVEAEITGIGAKLKMPSAPPVRTMQLEAAGKRYELAFVVCGVPHVVLPVEDLAALDVPALGAALRYHAAFQPAGTNANFIVKTGDDGVSLRTYERGVEAETLACGTGACAAAIVAAEMLAVRSPVKVLTRGGDVLVVHLERGGDGGWPYVHLEGPAVEVYRGAVNWPPE